ncbi:hypothetical protein BGZ91_012269 [Linnemannia elongata]|nr:hypothetical protein BGZ91_012269 [Linnemannia elongata]
MSSSSPEPDKLNPQSRDPTLPSFTIRVLQALQRPHRQHQSSSSISINISRSKLYSSKLVCQGNQPLEDICSTVENCPSSLKEFTLHSLYSYNYYPQHITDSTLIVQRLGSIKDNCYFNNLQELYIPFGVTLQYYHQLRSSSNERDATVISTLALDCLALTAINFGYKLIAEELMFRFVKLMPETLLEFTTAIEPGYLDRVIPTLLRRSGSSLQVLRLSEQDFDGTTARSTYIVDILFTCAEWVCSGLETLSIGIRDLAEYEAEQEMDKQLALYLRNIHNVKDFCRRLQSFTPSLQTLDLAWSHLCQGIPYDPYSHDIEFPDNLRWMNLKWFPIYGGLESTTTTQKEAMQRYSEKKSDLALQRKLQESGILVSEIQMGFMQIISSTAVVGMTGGGIRCTKIV